MTHVNRKARVSCGVRPCVSEWSSDFNQDHVVGRQIESSYCGDAIRLAEVSLTILRQHNRGDGGHSNVEL
jgi:hypothetical protein